MRYSIIVPVYNGEKYISECLESVAKQTCDDYELIVVDDGSTDNSGAIVDAFAAEHKNVCVLHDTNQGLLLARRKGLSQCQGEYVVFLDSDDVLRVDALEIISRCLNETGADLVSFRFSRCADFLTKDDLNFLPEGLYDGKNYRLVEMAVCAGLSNNLWGKAIRLDCIDVNVAYEEHKRLMLAEDLLQLLPIVDSADSFARIEDVLYYYRPNESSSTASFRHSYIDDTEHVAIRLLDYGERWKMADEVTSGVLRLYASLSKMLADSVSSLGKERARSELAQIRATLLHLLPDAGRDLGHMRVDQRVLLGTVLADNLTRLRLVTAVSHFGRKILGRSI